MPSGQTPDEIEASIQAEKVQAAREDSIRRAQGYAERTEMLSVFQANIAEAKANGHEWCETDQSVIDRIMPRGLGPAKFFIYEGIKVCPYGQSEAIEAEMDIPIGERLHGKLEGKLEGKESPT